MWGPASKEEYNYYFIRMGRTDEEVALALQAHIELREAQAALLEVTVGGKTQPVVAELAVLAQLSSSLEQR